MRKELVNLKNYILSEESENATSHLVYPFFQKVFKKDKFKKESAASGADIYIEGRLVVELKTKEEDWVQGFYQALHYNKKGLSFSAICVISHNFIGLWRLEELPDFINDITANSDPNKSANEIGRINANKTNKGKQKEILKLSTFLFNKNQSLLYDIQLSEFEDLINNLDVLRTQINPDNFLRKIGILKTFIPDALEAIHCFYTMLPYWDVTSKVPNPRTSKQNTLWINGQNGSSVSDEFTIDPKCQNDFRKFVENHYIFTNDEEGISIDYYFSRFDEALAKHNPEYVKQHGIFFTDINLSRFAFWFIREKFGEKKLSDKYIVIDPAGGSGNLISSWRKNHLKFKIISELNPDLLKTIEMRFKHDPQQIQQGFSIIPKTYENKGLNFIDKPAKEYYEIITNYLNQEGKIIDRPLAFLLNPPYKNTDENVSKREKAGSNYDIDESLIKLAGNDASKERYIVFLAQILEICKLQRKEDPDFEPILMIFTPTPWLIPRPTFIQFRDEFDKYFKFEKGFMITGKEFFKGTGRWPVAFTIWRYSERKNNNKLKLLNLTELKSIDFSTISWNEKFEIINTEVKKVIRGSKEILFDSSRGDIRDSIPKILDINKNQYKNQTMFDFKRDRTKTEKNMDVVGGLPLNDPRRKYKKTYGIENSEFIGFMMNGTPCRIKQDKYNRISKRPDRLWFKLDTYFKNINYTTILGGPPDKYGYCAFSKETAQCLCSWYAGTQALNGVYPVWANQFNIWSINVKEKYKNDFFSLCFSYILVDNRCVVVKFEKDNPVIGAPEIFVDNPLCPINPDSFWSTILEREVQDSFAQSLVVEIKSLYDYWNLKYCKGQILENVGLNEEPYFKYFDYPDFVTPYSGLIQIRKYAEINGKSDLLEKFENIKELTKKVKNRIYDLLVNQFKYFE